MRYQQHHYKDVAKILSEHSDYLTAKVVTDSIIRDFADLFAADNPPMCQVGSHDGPCTSACLIPGFNREQFLEACGLA